MNRKIKTVCGCAILALASAPSAACEVPDEGGNTPWRRAVSKVKYLPETEVWTGLMSRDRNLVQYVVTPDGAKILEEGKR